MSNVKRQQLASAIERALREVIAHGFQDPRIAGLVTVTNVHISGDGKDATVGISVLPAEKGELTLHGLRAAARHIRREVGDLVRVRSMPLLHFRDDQSLKKQAQVLSVLEQTRDSGPVGFSPARPAPPAPAMPQPTSRGNGPKRRSKGKPSAKRSPGGARSRKRSS